MSQALHIFRKDLRYLRLEIALFLVFAALFAALSTSPLATAVNLLVIVGAIHLTARAVHAETIPGTNQFWTTRPYRWQSLLIAKLLFIAVCIDLPVAAARFTILATHGYPLVFSLPALLWSQLLLFAAMLPVAALAALTAGIMEFSVGMLELAVVYLLTIFVSPFAVRSAFFWPVSVEWFHSTVILILFLGIAAVVLLWQYRDRRTKFSRTVAVAAATASVIVYIALPAAAGLTVETWLSHGPEPQLQVRPDLNKKNAAQFLPTDIRRERSGHVARVPVPLRVTGVPEGVEIAADAIHLTLDWPDGQHWSGNAALTGIDRTSIGSTIDIPFDLYQGIQTPVRMRGSLYLTLFGEPESRTIPFTNHPVNAQDGLQCYSGFDSKVRDRDSFNHYSCRAFFGWPSRLVYAKAGDRDSEFTRLLSYAPFPSGIDLDSNESRYTSLVLNDSTSVQDLRDVTIVTKKPLVHFRRDFDTPGVNMHDFLVTR